MRLRFSVRTILLVTTIVALYLGFMIPAAHTQRKAVEALRAVGGQVEYNGKPEKLSGIAKYIVNSLGPDWFYRVKAVSLTNLALPKCALKPLRDLPAVTSVNLFDTTVTDEDLADLSNLRSLQSLELSNCKLISDVGLQTVSSHKSLQYIGLNRLYRMTDEGFACMASMPNMKRISSSDTEITNKALESINNHALLSLSIVGVQVSDTAIEETRRRLPKITIVDSATMLEFVRKRLVARTVMPANVSESAQIEAQ